MSRLSSPKGIGAKVNNISVSDQDTSPNQTKTQEEKGNCNIKVVCRFRPANEHESIKGDNIINVVNNSAISVGNKENKTTFTFDRVFDADTDQQEIYQYSISQTVGDFLNGYNGTILAYGQTGSGKSYTMMGPSISDSKLMGIIPRIADEIFDKINNSSSDIEYSARVSYMEIHMEQIKDLLDVRSDINKKFAIQEDKTHGIHVKGLSHAFVSSSKELCSILKQGSKSRSNCLTGMNTESSRSHAILEINLTQKQLYDDTIKRSRLFLVDLAGSEKVDKTGAIGQTLEEAKKINSSLSTLGNVINALSDGRSIHIPYRDSKLTRILQESLGGNSRTSLIINCSPSSVNELETLSTLRFGSRAKKIKNRAYINTELSPSYLHLRIQSLEKTNEQNRAYIEKLENELSQWKNSQPLTPSKTFNSLPGDGKLMPDHISRIPTSPKDRPSKSYKLIDELKQRDTKIVELENTIVKMQMENLKISHQDELKLFKLEDTLHKLSGKLNDVEIINVNLRKHLLISEKIIESRDIKIEKLKSSLKEQQFQVLRDGANFESRLSSIKEKLDLYALQKADEESQHTESGVQDFNQAGNSRRNSKDNDTEKSANKDSGMRSPFLESPLSPKIGLNLNIVKPLRGGRSYFEDDSYF